MSWTFKIKFIVPKTPLRCKANRAVARIAVKENGKQEMFRTAACLAHLSVFNYEDAHPNRRTGSLARYDDDFNNLL